ncbi:MAG: TonB-dependent receptor [Pseudomonadota bacterium]|nr:TonB-dependent receptor [Pseudomonadota bacterium]
MADIFDNRRIWLRSGAATCALVFAASAPAQPVPVPPEEGPPAAAQEASQESGASDEDEIIVTGFRAALESATAEKRESEQIVESVTAEDIGRLPDASIAESIARLPGLTSQRLSGRANVISIRGFGPDFSQTLLNGREQTSTGDNRAVEFDQYPSEIVREVVVYKSPQANLVGQGLVGTIDIRTIRPLASGSREVFAIGARASYADLGALNSGSRDTGYRINATYVDQFADDTIGIAIAGSYVDEPYQLQEFNAWGYDNRNGNALIGGSKSYVTSTQLTRLGLQGTLQVQAAPTLMLTLDGFYSRFDDDQIKRGIELPLAFGGWIGTGFDPSTATVEQNQYVSGTFTNVEGVVRNDAFERRADLLSFGFNAHHDGDNGWNAWFDAGYSRTDRNELILESYSGTGYGAGNGATDTIGFRSTERGTIFSPTLNYADPNLIRLTDPLGWGGARVQAGYYNNRIVDDELMQLRAQIGRELIGFLSSVNVGANYTMRDKTLTPDESFLMLASGRNEEPIPSRFLLEPTNLSYLGLGPMVSYNPNALLAGGVYRLEPNAVQDVFAKGYTVREDLLTAYVQANIESSLGSAALTGNFGVQAIRTDQESEGFIFTPTGPQPRTLGDTYWDVLPSLNLALRFPSDWVIRFAAAREIQRPRLDDMRVSIGYGVDRSGPTPIIRGGGGNPFLRPFRANSVNFNVERYFGTSGYVAVQLFYKDLESFIYQNVERPFDFTNFPLPEGVTVPSPIGTISQPANTGGGNMYGAELAATLPFSIVSPALAGFGFTGGIAYTDTNVRRTPDGPLTEIPGYSRWVANGTAFFERWGFSARGSVRYRSTFLGELTQFGGARGNRRALGETIVDAQIGYDFQPGSALEGASIYLQGLNLTDERFATVTNPNTPLQVIDYQIYGRRFLAGFTFRF